MRRPTRDAEDFARRYTGPAYARARRLTDDAHLAEDIAQEAMVAALEGLEGLRTPNRAAAWLAAIVDRTAMRMLRAERPEPAIDAEAGATSDGPERTAERRELQRLVRSAVEALPARSRVAVELHYFAGMSCREVGEFLDVSPDAVKMTLYRARRALRRGMSGMTHAAVDYPRIVWCNHGKTSYRSPLPDHEADEALIYAAIYHRQGEVPSGNALGMAPERVEAALAYLERAYLIEWQGSRVRCRAPIITRPDVARLRPWVERLIGQVAPKLREVEPVVERIAARYAADDRQRSTVRWAALLLEASQRPFREIRRALDSATPEKGEFGAYTVAYGTEGTLCWGTRKARRLASGSHCEVEGEWVYYDLKGHGQDVDALWRFEREWGLRERLYGWTSTFVPLLERVGQGSVPIGEVPGLIQGMTDANNEPWPPTDVDARRLAHSLAAIHAVTVDGDSVTQGAVPVIPLSAWQDVLDAYAAIASDISDHLDEHIDDLRARVAYCSFADCDFDQVVHGALGQIAEPVRERAREEFGLTFPDRADMDWGSLLASASLQPRFSSRL